MMFEVAGVLAGIVLAQISPGSNFMAVFSMGAKVFVDGVRELKA